MEAPATPTDIPPPRKPGYPAIAAGVVLSPLAFAFGGWAGLLALPAVIPKFKRLRAPAYGYFGGVVVCWLASMAGFNPWLDFARQQAEAEMEAALGAPIRYEKFRGDATRGELTFSGLSATLPEGTGELQVETLEIDAGYGLLLRRGPVKVQARAMTARLDPAQGRLERWLSRERADGDVVLEVTGAVVTLAGAQTSARVEVAGITGGRQDGVMQLNVALRRIELTVLGQAHDLRIVGGLWVRGRGETLAVGANLSFSSGEDLHGVVQGSLEPGGAGSLDCTLDYLALEPVWGRYRKVDRLAGTLRGRVSISGALNDLHMAVSGEVMQLTYFHRAVMALDETRSFTMASGELSGEVRLIEGERWEFKGLSLATADCTLATDPRMNAMGGGRVTLNGPVDQLAGTLEASVESGRLSEPISWNPLSDRSLSDLQPNIVMIGEQFHALDLAWRVKVNALDVACAPLYGKAGGELSGTLAKEPGKRVASLRVSGSLELRDGTFSFLGAAGTAEASVSFNPQGPSMYATLRGKLKGQVGSTPLFANISGTLHRPAFEFRGVTMAPDELGRKIFEHSESPLSTAEVLRRREDCSRLCGVQASTQGNPFLARNTGKVFFKFNPAPPEE